MGLPIALGAAALAGGRPGDPRLPFGIIAVWLLVAAMHTMNDIIDVERDKIKFPMRPLPSGLIPRWMAAIYATTMAGIGVMVAYLTFNWLCASIALTVIVLGCIYTRYTRDKIGYLTLVWIPAFEPVGAWAAVSPETLQTPLPWLLYTFLAIHQVAMMIAEEVADPSAKALLVRPKPNNEMALYALSIIAMFLVGVTIFFYARLHSLYMLMLIGITIWALNSAKHLGEPRSLEKGKKTFMTITFYNIIYWTCLAITSLIP
jgi:4-hydroxybenzoate polyprenyltransferase